MPANPLYFADLCLHTPVAPRRVLDALLLYCPAARDWCSDAENAMDLGALAHGIAEQLPDLLHVPVEDCITRRWAPTRPRGVRQMPACIDLHITPLVECLRTDMTGLRVALPVHLRLATLDTTQQVTLDVVARRLHLPPRATWVVRCALGVRDHIGTAMPGPTTCAYAPLHAFHTPGDRSLQLPFHTLVL